MNYGYYPGCSLHSTGAEYDASFRAVSSRLGIALKEVPGWICCGTSPAHSSSHLLATSLPIKNLILAGHAGLKELAVPCAACFSRFKAAIFEVGGDKKLKREVEDVIGSPFTNSVGVIHPLEMIDKIEPQIIKENTKKDLSELKIVCYYGCLLTRPPKVAQFDDCEYPMSMDRILKKCGVDVLDWSYKTDCCGATFSLTETNAVIDLTYKILENAKAVGASAVAVACPLCHANLDTRQAEVEAKYNVRFDIPILYFTQVLGLAFGLEPRDLGLNKHIVSPERLLGKIVDSGQRTDSRGKNGNCTTNG